MSQLIDVLQEDAFIGEDLGHNCYKIRLAITSKNKGKSGGARVITQVYVKGYIIYLIAIYDKSVQTTITDKELLQRLKNLG